METLVEYLHNVKYIKLDDNITVVTYWDGTTLHGKIIYGNSTSIS